MNDRAKREQEQDFNWAVGIENTFIPDARPGLRPLEEYELTGHYQLWREDLDRAASLGVSQIRWGVPWYRVNPAPGRWEWGWVDDVLGYLVEEKKLQPILDLMHYGTPGWIENAFLNASYPERVAEYARTFAERYRSLVRYYTPLNEPGVNADFCGRRAEWPPYLEGDDGYVKVLMQISRGIALTAQALREVDPDAILVQVEALAWSWSKDERLQERVAAHLAEAYLPFDLFTGRVDEGHPLWPFLRQHGVTTRELAWLGEHAVQVDILGVNLYPWSGGEWGMDERGRPHLQMGLSPKHLGQLLRHTWQRYRIPMMVTETSAREDVPGRARWMDGTIAAVREVRAEEIPVVGYTWFPMFTMIDWAYRTGEAPLADYLLDLGLWEGTFDESGRLGREPTPLVERYRGYVSGSR